MFVVSLKGFCPVLKDQRGALANVSGAGVDGQSVWCLLQPHTHDAGFELDHRSGVSGTKFVRTICVERGESGVRV